MTLKEKFKDKILSFLSDNMKEQNAIECEKIAEQFAIEFAEWSVARAMGLDSFKLNNGELETFKKEKKYVDKDN